MMTSALDPSAYLCPPQQYESGGEPGGIPLDNILYGEPSYLLGAYSYPAATVAAYQRYYDDVISGKYLTPAAAVEGSYDYMSLYRPAELVPRLSHSFASNLTPVSPRLIDYNSGSSLDYSTATTNAASRTRTLFCDDIKLTTPTSTIEDTPVSLGLTRSGSYTQSTNSNDDNSSMSGNSKTNQVQKRSPTHPEQFNKIGRLSVSPEVMTGIMAKQLNSEMTVDDCFVDKRFSIQQPELRVRSHVTEKLHHCTSIKSDEKDVMNTTPLFNKKHGTTNLDVAESHLKMAAVDVVIGRQTVINETYAAHQQLLQQPYNAASLAITRRLFSSQDLHTSESLLSSVSASDLVTALTDKYLSNRTSGVYNNGNTYRPMISNRRDSKAELCDTSVCYPEQYESVLYRQHQCYNGREVDLSEGSNEKLLPLTGYKSVIVDPQQFNFADGFVH